ncbi:MAG: hypothetical protein AAGI52_15535 [Bacteroidota bacterium]
MRPLLSILLLALLVTGCDFFGSETLRVRYTVNATGANGPVTLTYDTSDGPVRVEGARVPFTEDIQINNPRIGSVYLLNAETTCTGPCTLTAEVAGAVGSTPITAEDEVVYPADTTRTLGASASILFR